MIQLDSDPQPSSFDAVAALDADVDHLLQYGGVTPEGVEPLVHGAIFTRGGRDLANTALFIGGTQVADGERLLQRVRQSFFGPLRVSVMLDPHGANTTAVAAVLSAARELDLSSATALVLAATGPVGERVARLLAQSGARVLLGSRKRERAAAACQRIRQAIPDGDPVQLTPLEIAGSDITLSLACPVHLVVAAGAAGVGLTSLTELARCPELRVAIDLNAVPPLGIEGVASSDRGRRDGGICCYGAIGVGALKMKLHRRAIQELFTSPDLVLDAHEILALGRELLAQGR